jgi:hypothetical protein
LLAPSVAHEATGAAQAVEEEAAGVITYTVHEAPEPPADRLDRAEALAFVKEGFSVWAAAFPPIWLIVNRLWLVLAFYVSAAALIEVLFWALDIGQRPAAIVMGALHLLIGFEGDALKRWTLARKGWHMIGSVNGRNAEDCERRFLDSWLAEQPAIRASALAGTSMTGSGQPGPLTRPEAPRARGWRTARILGGLR